MAIRVQYNRYEFAAPKIDGEEYSSIKKLTLEQVLFKIYEELEFEKSLLIGDGFYKILHYYFRVSYLTMMILYFAGVITFAIFIIISCSENLASGGINNFNYQNNYVLYIIVIILRILAGIMALLIFSGFFIGLSHNLSYRSFRKYSKEKIEWYKELKKCIDLTYNYEEFKQSQFWRVNDIRFWSAKD